VFSAWVTMGQFISGAYEEKGLRLGFSTIQHFQSSPDPLSGAVFPLRLFLEHYGFQTP